MDKFDVINESINDKIIGNDRIGLLLTKLDSCAKMNAYDKSVYECMMPKIDKALSGNFENIVSDVVPYFTLDEMNEICPDNNIGNIDPDKYYSILREEFSKYNNAKSIEEKANISNNILSLGWNPSVELNEKNIKFARNRQIKWLQERACKVIDLTKMNTDVDIVQESSSSMKKLYDKNKLYPVYIVLSFTNTPFGKVIRTLKHSTYTHAGLCLDSDLKNIVTFKFGSMWNGFSTESLDFYINVNDGALLDVLAIFVDEATRYKLELAILDFVSKKDKTKYGFGNLFNILLNRAKNNDPEALSMVCSQFVDTVLKIANIDLTNKPSNLVIPQDFQEISKNPKVYKVYEGLAKEYDEKKVERSISSLFKTTPISQISYNDAIDLATESFCPSSFYYTTENSKANEILKEIRYLLTPEAVVYERKLPFKFNDKGDLSINFSKSLEQEYQDSHKLLTSYSSDNMEGIKHELARLFFINSTIEKKIKKMKKDDERYKVIIDLRARVLNDFKKYFKAVLKEEKEFNFTEYYKNSEYYDSSITIDNTTMKFIGSLIKKIPK